MTGTLAQGPIVETRASGKRLHRKESNMTHDAETETAAALIEDLLYPLRTRGGQIN